MIRYILGKILMMEAALMMLPVICGICYGESSVLWFVVTIAILLAVGIPISRKRPKDLVIYAREGFVVVALCWILMSAFGALPFVLSGTIPNYLNAFFETVSGFTTTGATILPTVETLDRCLLFWRNFTHWIGGMGVLVFVMAVLPLSNEHSMHLMRAEIPGPIVGKLAPKARSTAKILYGIYIGLSLLEIILLLAGGMPLFDSLNYTFSTAGTGGFAIHDNCLAHYNNAYFDSVINVFMLLFGIDFTLFYLLLAGNIRTALRAGEFRWYLGIIAAATAMITINILPQYEGVVSAFRHAVFHVVSVITTTGFTMTNLTEWPQFSQMLLVLLMVIGACAGSTGGGMKVSRVMIMVKGLAREVRRIRHPRVVQVIKLNDQTLSNETFRMVNTFLLTYVMAIFLSALIFSIDGYDFTTNITAAITAMGNAGPGLGAIYPPGTFDGFSWLSKIVLCFDMLLGRLEIFPMLILLSPRT